MKLGPPATEEFSRGCRPSAKCQPRSNLAAAALRALSGDIPTATPAHHSQMGEALPWGSQMNSSSFFAIVSTSAALFRRCWCLGLIQCVDAR